MIYLIVYNLMFILPLLVIFGMTYLGTTVSILIKMSKRNVVLAKCMLGMLFVAMAVLVAVIG